MKFDVSYITNMGLAREHNEDSILINENLITHLSMGSVKQAVIQEDRAIFAVADGMGGHAKGEIASRFILTKLKQNILQINNKDSLKDALESISKDIKEFAKELPQYRGMGSVLAGILALKDSTLIFNVGDCRVYENSFGYANQLTKDHSLVYQLYEAGEIEYEDIKSHPDKNIVASAFIADNKESIDIFIKEIKGTLNSNLLICSDGVWESMNTQELEGCLEQDTILECIKSKVLKAGAKDNFSAICIKVRA